MLTINNQSLFIKKKFQKLSGGGGNPLTSEPKCICLASWSVNVHYKHFKFWKNALLFFIEYIIFHDLIQI